MKNILKYISAAALALGIAATPAVAQHHGGHFGGHGGHFGGHYGGGIHHGGVYHGGYGGGIHRGGVYHGGHWGHGYGRGHWRGGVWVPWVAGGAGYGWGSCYGTCIARGYGPAVCSVDPTPYCQ